jgi:CheY-like chemotaxis protein
MKILIAEDQIAIAENFKILLESEGQDVILTHDGEACLQMYNRALIQGSNGKATSNNGKRKAKSRGAPQKSKVMLPPFNVVVLDVRMPKLDGVEVAKEIISICPNQKILMATAYGEEIAPRILSEQLGTSVDILQKPIDLEKFAAMINDLN